MLQSINQPLKLLGDENGLNYGWMDMENDISSLSIGLVVLQWTIGWKVGSSLDLYQSKVTRDDPC